MLPEKSLQIFISYSRVNQQFAIRLACELKSAGFCVWMDQFDIPTGARWDEEIEKALRECQIFLFIMTPASITSQNAKDEVGYAIDHGKRVLPVLLEDCEVPLRLRRLQYVDFTRKSFNEGIESATELLSKLVNEAGTSVSETAKPVSGIIAGNEPRTVPTAKGVAAHQTQPTSRRPGKSTSKLLTAGIGIGIVSVLSVAVIFLRPLLFTPPPSPSPTSTTAPTRTAISTETAELPAPTIPVMPTTAVLRSFTEDFNSYEQWEMNWTLLFRHGDPRKESNFKYAISDGNLIVDLTDEFVWGYFLYNSSVIFNNVELEVVVANLRSTDTFGLICQFGDQGWYEFDINGGGSFRARYVDNIDSSRDEDGYITDYGFIPGFKDSYATTRENTIRAGCDNNNLTLSVNDSELMKNVQSKFVLEQGQIGTAVRSYGNYPIHVIVESIKVSEP